MSRVIAGYTLPDTLNDLTPVQQKASDLKRAFEQRLTEIRNDRSLSNEGKQTLIARAWLPFKPAFEALQKQDSDQYEQAKRDQRFKLVGIKDKSDPASVITFMDSMQRAQAIPTAGADVADRQKQAAAVQDLLTIADLSGSDVLARAVLCVALDRGLTDVVRRYEEQYPQEAEEIADYRELLDFDPTVTMTSYYLWQVRTPQEIATAGVLSNKTLEEMAEQSTWNEMPGPVPPQQVPSWLDSATERRAQAEARTVMRDAPRIEV